MIKAQWIGGPRDGEECTLPDGLIVVSIPYPLDLPSVMQSEPSDSCELRTVQCVVTRSEHGYRIIWKEPS